MSKKYRRKFEINFRKIAIKLLKKNFNPNVLWKIFIYYIHYSLSTFANGCNCESIELLLHHNYVYLLKVFDSKFFTL